MAPSPQLPTDITSCSPDIGALEVRVSVQLWGRRPGLRLVRVVADEESLPAESGAHADAGLRLRFGGVWPVNPAVAGAGEHGAGERVLAWHDSISGHQRLRRGHRQQSHP